VNSYDKLRGVLVLIIILGLGLGWIWSSRIPEPQLDPGPIAAPQAGFNYPQFDLKTASGGAFNTIQLTGRPLIINFWASWCPPCRAEMPDFQKAALEFAETDLVITAINATNQDSLPDVLAFIEANQLSIPILLDQTGLVSRTYNVHSLPTTYFIDRDGMITKVIIGGPIPLALLRVEINNLVKE
jgi:cytochrome c biogenesis protein CcmG/thiol:disulfide interchange protein DsbE